jgi:hypothetical protein
MGAHQHAEELPPPSGEGTVVLDVGGTKGALILFTPESFEGKEIEIRPLGAPWDGTHTAVRRRDLRDSVAYAGLFGSLPEGSYQARIKGCSASEPGSTILDLELHGGEVTQMNWPH